MTYSHTMRVKIGDAMIIDLNKFRLQFINAFEFYMGSDIVMEATILKYEMQRKLIKNIVLCVKFHVPLNYQYINSFAFPSNWSFYPMTQQIKKRFR